jgi:hypothetical protein
VTADRVGDEGICRQYLSSARTGGGRDRRRRDFGAGATFDDADTSH